MDRRSNFSWHGLNSYRRNISLNLHIFSDLEMAFDLNIPQCDIIVWYLENTGWELFLVNHVV
jgi:hypothetical protein